MRVKRESASKLAGLVLTLAAMAAAGCVQPAPEQPSQNAGGGGRAQTGKVRIGFSMDTLKEERWQRDHDLVKARAEAVGAEIEIQVANGSDADQSKQCENMLTKGVDVLIVAPHNGVAAAAIVEMAKKKNVPVISYDRLIMNSDVDLYVSHQVTKIGQMQAQYALDHAPRGNYVIIYGSQTDNNAMLLKDGQMSVLKPAIDSGTIKVISELHAREWLASEARRITDDALTKAGNDIQAIVASNDGTAGGAISALPSSLVGKVLVTGQDAELPAVQRIAQGEQTMTIYKPITPLAHSAVDSAMKLARGEKVETTTTTNNQKIDVPSILHEPLVADKNNLMQTVVKDGYHKYEDVYKNVPEAQRPPRPASAATASRPAFYALPALLTFFVAGAVFVARRRVTP
ncbi:MAG TPA: substrate-binding domain-containing protein [Pyrinomonadaceae bacterium]|nr:substrate-binding domain-containing protein [Pyrinomonadaceae bacterium]